MKIRPLQGQVLIYMDAQDTESDGGIAIPSKFQERAKTGRVVRTGIWKQNRAGNLIPFPVKRGDKVVVNPRVGKWLHEERDRWKLVPMERILAIIPVDNSQNHVTLP